MSTPHPFTCEDAFRRLNDFLDRELRPEEMRLLREHLDACAACAREYRFEASVRDGVRAKARSFEIPPTLFERVFRRLSEAADAAGPG